MNLPADSLRSGWVTALRMAACAVASAALLRASGVPDRASAGAVLEQFRSSIWAEPLYAEFDLLQIPRRGPERVYHGRLWGSRNAGGPVTRFELGNGFAHHVLIQGGMEGHVWTSDGPGAGSPDEAALLAPMLPGLEMTPFDVQMPYLYWLDWNLARVDRIRGRQAYAFTFSPSGDFRAAAPGIRSVTAYLDAQYDALVQSEIAGPDGRVSKTLSLLELRKVGDRWIPKDVDVRNESTRDKTRLTFKAVALGFMGAPAAFDASQLGVSAAPPPRADITAISQ